MAHSIRGLFADEAYVYTKHMTRVMDGVRPTASRVQPMVLPKRRVVASAVTPEPQRFVVGMDGIRRAVAVSPREALTRMHGPVDEPIVQASPSLPPLAVASPAAAAVIAPELPVWRMPSLRLPQIGWRRPAIAFGLIATALVASGSVVRVMATPQATTASAAAERLGSAPGASTLAAVAPTPAPTPAKTGLQEILNNFVAANPDKFGIVVKDMNTGETASISPDKQITSASLYKIFVAQRIYQRIDLNQLTYGKPAGGGTGRTIDGCLTVMINVSDNGCGRALGSILGWGAQNQALAAEGYTQTNLATPQKTSAGDVATLFTRLYNGTLVSPDSSAKFMALLKDQRVNNRLPVGLPAGTVIAHKTGDLDGVVHDAGIVYGPKTNYLVVVTSGPWKTPGVAPAMFADLSAQLWNYFEN